MQATPVETRNARAVSATRDARLRHTAKLAAILTFLLAVTAATVAREVPRDRPQLLLSPEFAGSAEEVRRLAPEAIRGVVGRAQRLDSLLFIPSYLALFLVSGYAIVLSGGARNRSLGRLVMGLISVAAVCDWAENAAIAAAFGGAGSAWGSPPSWAYAKWLLLYATVGTLGVALLAVPVRRFHGVAAGVLVTLAGAAGASATMTAVPAMLVVVFATFAALVLVALLWLWSPEYLVPKV